MRPRAVTPPCSPTACVLFLLAATLVVAAIPGTASAATDGRADGPAATPPSAPEPAPDLADVACPDPLVVHRPDGSVGDTSSVAITSQAFGRDDPGWASVGWQAAPGTSLTAILVTTPSGVQQRPGEPSGTASGALELTFCGTHDPTAAPSLGDDRAGAATTAERTAPVRFDGPAGTDTSTLPGSVFGAAFGLAVGAVVLLLSRGARREREAKR